MVRGRSQRWPGLQHGVGPPPVDVEEFDADLTLLTPDHDAFGVQAFQLHDQPELLGNGDRRYDFETGTVARDVANEAGHVLPVGKYAPARHDLAAGCLAAFGAFGLHGVALVP